MRHSQVASKRSCASGKGIVASRTQAAHPWLLSLVSTVARRSHTQLDCDAERDARFQHKAAWPGAANPMRVARRFGASTGPRFGQLPADCHARHRATPGSWATTSWRARGRSGRAGECENDPLSRPPCASDRGDKGEQSRPQCIGGGRAASAGWPPASVPLTTSASGSTSRWRPMRVVLRRRVAQ